MADLTVARATQHVLLVEGETEDGIEFVDCYHGPLLDVLDSGRILIPAESDGDLLREARRVGLEVDRG